MPLVSVPERLVWQPVEACVTVSDVNDEAGEALVEFGCDGKAVYCRADVTDDKAVSDLMFRAADAFGGIDVLHNNAGIHESMLTKN